MTRHVPPPPWVKIAREMLERLVAPHGLQVGVCWRPNLGRVDFSVEGVSGTTIIELLKSRARLMRGPGT